MLPRRGPHVPCRRSSGNTCLLSTLYVLAGMCLAAPFIYWQYRSPLLSQQQAELTPLQRMQQQNAFNPRQDSETFDSTSQSTEQLQELKALDADGFTAAQQVAAAQKYMDSIQHPKPRAAIPASKYVIKPEPFDMRRQHKQVETYLQSSTFAAKQAARRQQGGRGIVINAGGPHLLSTAIVTIKVLREVLDCHLPIQLVWHTSDEMDAATLAVLQDKWGPISGLDLSKTPWPAHHRQLHPPEATQNSRRSTVFGRAEDLEQDVLPAERAAVKQRGFLYKVWSLAQSPFASALLLDADNLPLVNPERLFDDASFKLNGNLFWPDFWPPGTSQEAQDVVYDMVGLEADRAWDILAAGKGPGMSWRATESGQVLLDLARHGDVAEWALWINSFGDSVYRALWGDKDTYALAFGVAGKAHEFNQLQVPPSGAFAWRPRSVLVKATEATTDGWQLAGMVQYDAWAQPAFLHRTMNKLSVDGEPWQIGLLTAPLALSWIQYYLSLDSLGPTVGVPVTYAAPASAFAVTRIQQESSRDQDCPTSAFQSYWALRQQAVPVGAMTQLDNACSGFLTSRLGNLAPRYQAAKLDVHPELLALLRLLKQGRRHNQRHYGYNPTEAPDPAPVVAWSVTPIDAAAAAANGAAAAAEQSRSSVGTLIAASHSALLWLQQHRKDFPLLQDSMGRRLSDAFGRSGSGSSGGGSSSSDGGAGQGGSKPGT